MDTPSPISPMQAAPAAIRRQQAVQDAMASVDDIAELTVGERTVLVRTRTASPAEKAELWPQIVAVSSIYDNYQRKTAREIPVVICEERD